MNLPLFNNAGRLSNGVKRRHDGGGDAWANAHRQLPSSVFLQDIDSFFGSLFFGKHCEEELFVEYEPDHFRNASSWIREFGVVALFDRKSTSSAAHADSNNVSTAWYLWLCRSFAEKQPVAPKFFFVIGGQQPPWTLLEIDIYTGLKNSSTIIDENDNWLQLFPKLGLIDLRNTLRDWVAS